MTENFVNEITKTAVAVLCQSIGWNSAQTTAIDILGDIWKRQFLQIGKSAHRNAEHCGRSQVTLEDTMLAFNDMGISVPELEEYIHNFDPIPLPFKVPNFPVPKENHLNCLRPGSAEVLTRPVHIHEYMPPWTIPERNEPERKDSSSSRSSEPREPPEVNGSASQSQTQEKEADETALVVVEDNEKENLENGMSDTEKDKIVKIEAVKEPEEPGSPPPLESSGANSFASTPPKSAKRMDSQGESPALKRVRMMLEEEGHSVRQISSVMMTTSGFLTSSREGRLPDAKPPANRDFFEALPVVPVEKKRKIPTMKKIVEGVKKIERDRESEKTFDLFEKPDKIVTVPSSRDDDEGRTKDSKRDSSRRDKESSRRDKESSSSRRDKASSSKKDRQKLESSRKNRDRKFPKVNENDMKEKLNIFKKNMMKNSDKLARKARRLKLKAKERREMEEEEEEEEGLDIISSDEDFGDGETGDVKPDVNKLSKKRRRSKEGYSDHLNIKKLKKEKEKSKSPMAISLPKISPKFHQNIAAAAAAAAAAANAPPGVPGELPVKKKRGRPRKIIPGLPQIPTLTSGGSPIKMARISKKMQLAFGRDMKPLIPEISISNKPPPPPSDFSKMIGRLPMQPGLIPTSFAPPPSMRKSQNVTPSISITPATPTISGSNSPLTSKDNRSSQLPLPSSVCSSVTITRIDMSNSQKLPTPYDNSSTPGIGPQNQMSISITPTHSQVQKSSSSASASSNITIQADANSGITITPIVMDKGNREKDTGVQVEKVKVEKVSGLAKLEEDFRTKDQRKKDREKRKELKKEKKKERKEKERNKAIKLEKVEKKDRKEKDKDKEKEREKKKKSSVDPLSVPVEGLVPKITLKLHSNTNTPVDSPNPPQRMTDDRMETPPPRKITIKPVEEFVKKRTPSPELARFSPLVTRPPKSSKTSLPTKSPPIPSHSANTSTNEVVSFPASLNSKRGPGRPPKSGRGPGRPPKPSGSSSQSPQAGLVTETVGFYIDDQGTKVWICPSCGRQDDGSPMIGCDTCDDWYHFTCVGITDTPDDDVSWFCKRCISTQRKKSSSGGGTSEHRKKGPKL